MVKVGEGEGEGEGEGGMHTHIHTYTHTHTHRKCDGKATLPHVSVGRTPDTAHILRYMYTCIQQFPCVNTCIHHIQL